MNAREGFERRREVVQERQQKLNNDDNTSNLSVMKQHASEENTKADQQVTMSMSNLKQKLHETLNDISRIRVDFQNSEVTQQLKNESYRELNFNMAKKEKELSETESSLNDLWKEIEEKGDVRLMYTMLEDLKTRYSIIFQRKDMLIKELQQRMHDREEDYLKCLKEGETRINLARSTIEQSLISVEILLKKELKAIKDVYNEEQNDMTEENEKAVNHFFSENSALGRNNVNQIVVNFNKNEDQKIDLHNKLDLEFDLLKTKLMEDVTMLERELSVSKCLYDINIDQIEYNYRDLKTKNDEQSERIKKKRKRISQFKEKLRREFERFRIIDNQDSKKILTLEADCKRLESQHRNLVSKLHRFELMENQKYQSVMNMYNEEEFNLNARMNRSLIYISQLLLGTEIETEMVEDFALQLEKVETVLVKYNALLEETLNRRKSIQCMKTLNIELQSSLIEAEKTDISKSLIIAPL